MLYQPNGKEEVLVNISLIEKVGQSKIIDYHLFIIKFTYYYTIDINK